MAAVLIKILQINIVNKFLLYVFFLFKKKTNQMTDKLHLPSTMHMHTQSHITTLVLSKIIL